ncbi:hypothetical protein D3C71_1226840 [compost metagenome]
MAPMINPERLDVIASLMLAYMPSTNASLAIWLASSALLAFSIASSRMPLIMSPLMANASASVITFGVIDANSSSTLSSTATISAPASPIARAASIMARNSSRVVGMVRPTSASASLTMRVVFAAFSASL